MKIITLALVIPLVAGAALADVQLFRASPPALAASTAARISDEMRPTKSVVAVDPDPKALDTTVINVQLAGKTYRFVGAKRTVPPSLALQRAARQPASAVDEVEDVWQGETPEGDRAAMFKSKIGMTGQFFAGGKKFHMIRADARTVLVEVAPLQVRAYDGEPTPQMIEAARKRAAERR